MTLDPRRWDDPATYLTGSLHVRLLEVQREVNIMRTALVVARMELGRQSDEQRIRLWEDTVASQNRAIEVETRAQHNIVEQTEADLAQLVDERNILMFLIEHP